MSDELYETDNDDYFSDEDETYSGRCIHGVGFDEPCDRCEQHEDTAAALPHEETPK